MKPEAKEFLKHFLVEMLVYAGLVFLYIFLVLHFLGHWLEGLYVQDRKVYAGVALGLIVGQGIALEVLTTALLRLVRGGGGR
jgi:hypothetical protein